MRMNFQLQELKNKNKKLLGENNSKLLILT